MSKNNKKTKNQLNALFGNAASVGMISPQTLTMLSGNLGNLVIAGAAGKDTETIDASEVLLVTVLVDASSSIGSRGLEAAVKAGYNKLLDTFSLSKERDAIMMALWTFQGRAKVIHSYVPVNEAVGLDRSNYRPGGCTALYDTWCDSLAANLAYAQQLRDGGTPVRSVVVVITDGEDVGSKRRPVDCAKLTMDLLASEQFALGFVGVGSDVDFTQVARDMGIPDDCIQVQKNATPKGLRDVFHMVSRSVMRVSQSHVAPGQGGFFQ